MIIPLIILWASAATAYTHRFSVATEFSFWIAVILILFGLTLGIATSRLFLKFGEGTPAPWDPPKKLVIRGPYRYVRNPMISSVLISLTAEAIYFQSWPLLVWMGTFLLVNVIYFPLVEEKGLVARFGEDYKLYQANVPRWLPRLTPWSGHR
ncbi:MAG: isoprenylcysteine carboxylmethyltransferase family protein [Acidiferrobacterales bacterium]